MAEKNILDDINEVLKRENELQKYAYVSPENAEAFFAPAPNSAAPAQPAASAPPPRNRGQQRQMRAQRSAPRPAPSQAPPAPQQNMPALDLSKYDLASLKQLTDNCTRCPLHGGRTNGVFGDGNPNADLMFIGEGPGYDEDLQGLPFVGKAGVLLTKMIGAMQFTRQDVFIANIVKCRPPQNRNPFPEEALACLPYLKRQIELIKPKVIVLLGAVPLEHLMGIKGIRKMRGRWLDYNGIPVMPTYHPAYLLRFQEAKRDTWHDLQQVMQLFGKVHHKN